MEVLTHVYNGLTVALLLALGAGLLVHQLITPLERRLIGGTALLLAGVFFVARTGEGPLLVALGAASWSVGLGIFLRAGLAWRRSAASRAGPWAALFLLPPSVCGAVLLVGLLRALLEGPARLAARVVGG